MAQAYLFGPAGIKGDWTKASESAGFSRPPPRGSQTMRLAFEEASRERLTVSQAQANVAEEAGVDVNDLPGPVSPEGGDSLGGTRGIGSNPPDVAPADVAADSTLDDGAAPLESGLDAPRRPDSDVALLEALLSDGGDPDWSQLVPLAKRVLAKIAAGSIASNASQVAALKEIIKQKGSDDSDSRHDLGPVQVIVLPALVDKSDVMYVDPEANEVLV